jgi:hypothetical protein
VRSEELVRSLVEDLRPVRRLRGVDSRTLLWAAFALACVCIGVYALGARPDLSSKLGDPAYRYENASLLLVFILSARSAFHLSVPGLERGQATRTLPMVGLLVWLSIVALRYSSGAGEPAAGAAASLAGWSCVWRMIRLALLPSVALFLMLRRAAPQRREWTGWFALLSSGSLAMMGTQLICARDEPRHVLLSHCGAVLLVGLVGMLVARLVLSSGSARPS